MSQDQWMILALKMVIGADVLSVVTFIAIYWHLAPWYRNPIGRTIVIKDMLLILLLLPSLMSLFFHFNRLTSRIAAWVDVGLFVLMALAMTWRCVVWIRIHQQEDAAKASEDEAGS